MIKLIYMYNTPYTKLEKQICRFVNDNLIEIMDDALQVYDGDEIELKRYFPRKLYDLQPDYCKEFILSLRDLLSSNIIYKKITPLQSYVLYHMIEGWIDEADEITELLYFPIPEELRKMIFDEKHIPEEADLKKYEEDLLIFEQIANTENYLIDCFPDLDFLEESVRLIVEFAIAGDLSVFRYSYEQIDEFIDVMPLDVAEKYIKFRKTNTGPSKEEYNIEDILASCIQNAMNTFAKRIVHHENKCETVLTADLQEKIEDFLYWNQKISISREYTLGRAKKSIGETDLYFYIKEDGKTIDVAILENKNIEQFKNQYFQLMGYLNPHFRFGITVSINRHMRIADAEKYIVKQLMKIEGDFSINDIYKCDANGKFLKSTHTVPETGEEMSVYHFILNLYDAERQEAAKKRSKGTKS